MTGGTAKRYRAQLVPEALPPPPPVPLEAPCILGAVVILGATTGVVEKSLKPGREGGGLWPPPPPRRVGNVEIGFERMKLWRRELDPWVFTISAIVCVALQGRVWLKLFVAVSCKNETILRFQPRIVKIRLCTHA
jgi:hypothetical protein